MNIKIIIHICPWEIDQALMAVDKLKRSIYHIDPTDKIYIDTVLNLSSAIIDWDKSELPEKYFIKKYKLIENLLGEPFIHHPHIYRGVGIYGHLNLQKSCIEENIDAYIGICPDIDFPEQLLYYLIESAKQIEDEYFVVTPQIFKSWDSSWDILVNDKFKQVPYEKCIDVDIQEINYNCLDLPPPNISQLNQFKYAGWFDLYNKKFFEELVPVLDEWNGYGPWDLYSMNVCNIAKQKGVNVNQYLLENQVIWFNDVGCLRNMVDYGDDGQYKLLYKQFLSLKVGRQEQRSHIDQNLNLYLNKWVEYAKLKNII